MTVDGWRTYRHRSGALLVVSAYSGRTWIFPSWAVPIAQRIDRGEAARYLRAWRAPYQIERRNAA